MIQNGTYLNVIDNSGAKICYCIKVFFGFKRKYAFIGDLIVVSVKRLRTKRRATSKTKKGEIYKAVLIRTKKKENTKFGDTFSFFENSIVLLTKQFKFLGTRVFGSVPKKLRYTKFLKIVSLSAGLIC